MANKRNNSGRNFAIGALIAAAAGYITGVLTAPRSGKETREDIADKAQDVKQSAEDQLLDIQEEVAELLSNSKDKTVSLGSKAREEFNEAVIKAKDAQNKGKSVLKAFRAGEADDPELNRAIKQLKLARKNLAKYLKG